MVSSLAEDSYFKPGKEITQRGIRTTGISEITIEPRIWSQQWEETVGRKVRVEYLTGSVGLTLGISSDLI